MTNPLAGGAATVRAAVKVGSPMGMPLRPDVERLLTRAVVDTHVHCFAGKDNARFPYHPRAPYRPDAPATPQHLLQCMDEAGVDFAIIVHPQPYQDDHRYLEYCFDVGQSRFKGTCLFFADQPESLARMPDLVKRLPISAARIHAYAPDR